jgi:thymidylate synthase (FAD)
MIDRDFVVLEDAMADDLSVVNSARVSFKQKSQELTTSDEALINFLMRERHGTPFEHNAFRFYIKCPVFVAREWFRHRVGSFNEVSGRYTELATRAYTPPAYDIRRQTGKPSSYMFEPMEDIASECAVDIIQESYSMSFDTYHDLLRMGVAKELARMVLPMGLFTEFYWTVNARSLMNFLSLRSAPNAQREIRIYADLVEDLFAEKMPVTYSAWVNNNRVAP